MVDHSSPPRDEELPPGYDEDDPYGDVDLDILPEWWRRNVAEFECHGMRPYRPPRFADDALVPEVVASLEATLNVEIRFTCVDPQEGNEWTVTVDGKQVTTVTHEREGEGFTRYDIGSERFQSVVKEACDAGKT